MREWRGVLAVIITIVYAAPPAVAQSVIVQPKAIERPEPPFPIAAKAAGVEGGVRFRAVLNASGQVVRVDILSVPQPGLGFEQAVTSTVSRWKFSPAQLRGNPIESEYLGVLLFSLQLPGQAIFSASSKDTWKAVQDMFRQKKIPIDKRDDANQMLTSGRVRYLALPLPPLDSLGLPPGFKPERLTLSVYVTPGMEPARVSVGSMTELEPIANNDARRFTAYGLDSIGGWVLEELARRMGTRMEVMSASADRRAEQARQLLPPGLTDPCVATPAQFFDRQTRTAPGVSLPRKLYAVQPNYPKDQLDANKTAHIVFRGEITEHGTLINPTMTEPANAPRSFVSAAQLAFGQWRFAPPQVRGCPARMEGTFESTFTLK